MPDESANSPLAPAVCCSLRLVPCSSLRVRPNARGVEAGKKCKIQHEQNSHTYHSCNTEYHLCVEDRPWLPEFLPPQHLLVLEAWARGIFFGVDRLPKKTYPPGYVCISIHPPRGVELQEGNYSLPPGEKQCCPTLLLPRYQSHRMCFAHNVLFHVVQFSMSQAHMITQ